MSITTEFLEKFKEKHKPGIKKSELWKYADEIKELLEAGYGYKQIYVYLRDFRQIKFKEHTVYMFIYRNRDKILNSQTDIEQTTTQPIKVEPVKEEEPKQQPTAPEPKPQPATPKPKEPEPKQEQKAKTTPADRKKEFGRYLGHWDRQPENYLQYIEDKLNEKNFNAVMDRLIEEKLITSFEDIENTFKEPYRPEYICEYISVCRQKLKNKEDFKAFTPAMFKHFMDDNFFAKPKPEQI